MYCCYFQNRSSKFLVYGDMGSKNGSETMKGIMSELNTSHFDAVWHVGDFAYDMEHEGGKVCC